MRAGWTPELEVACRAPDGGVRDFIDAEIEVAADLRRRRAQWRLADGVVQRAHDFPAGNVLDAAGETTVLTLANAPAGNDLYEVHWLVTLTPVVPGAGTNTHKVVVVIETNADGAGWIERASFQYEVVRKPGQTSTVVVWAHEFDSVRVPGLDSDDQIRLRVKSASGPGGWAFTVHGYNLATDANPTNGVLYHTGLAVDFPVDGGVALADTAITVIENAVSDGYMQDLGGPPLSAAAAPFQVALLGWNASNNPPARDSVFDRIVAHLNPRVDGGQPRNVAYWLCQLYWMDVKSSNGELRSLAPASSVVMVPAQVGDAAEDITFSWATLPKAQKPRPEIGLHNGTALFVWAVQADGTPATNVGWGQDSATSSVLSGKYALQTIRIKKGSGGKWFDDVTSHGLPVLRCRFEAGSYPASATVAFTGAGAGSRFDLGAAPTKRVQLICRADVPPGAAATFQVRNDADSAWVTVLDGQFFDELGLVATQTRKAQVIIAATPGLDATPVVAEFGMRELELYPLHHCARLESARWAVDPLQLVAETTNARIVALRDDLMQEFHDRVTELLTKYFIGQVTFRVWAGTPARPRWLHIDDLLIDDEEFVGPEVGIPCVGVTALERGALPPYDDATETVTPLVYANKSLQFVYDDVYAKIGVSGRFLGPGVEDPTLVTKTLTESEAKDELDAVCFIDGSGRISSQGRIKAVRMYGRKAIARAFAKESIRWSGVTPGYRQRVPEVRVPYDWNEEEGRYRGEHKVVHGSALLRLGKARVDAPLLLPDAVTKWVKDLALAERLGTRHVSHLGTGLMLWFVELDHPEPAIEPGDCVALPTDRFATRNPSNDDSLSGELWAVGVVAAASQDFRTFAFWVRSLADIVGGSQAGSRTGFAVGVASAEYAWARGRYSASLTLRYVGTSGTMSVKIATSTSSLPAPGTGTVVEGQSASFADGKFGFGQTAYVTITPYGSPGGAGIQGPAYQFVVPPEALAGDFASSAYTHSGLTAFDATKVENLDYGDAAWDTDSAVAGAWLQLDTGAGNAFEFRECRIYAQAAGYAGVYDIEYSDNGSVWSLASAAFKPLAAGLNSRRFAGVGAHRYWRIKLTNTPGAGPSLSELDFVAGLPGIIIEKPILFDPSNERAVRTIDDTLERFRSVVKESGDRAVNLLFAKPLSSDPDTFNSVPDGTTFKKVVSVSSGGQVQTASIGDRQATIDKAGSSLATALSNISQQSRLINGGFQDALRFWDANPGGGGVMSVVNDGDTYKGTFSAKLAHTAGGSQCFFQSDDPRDEATETANWILMPVKPGARVKLRYATKVSGAGNISRVKITEYGAAGGTLGETQIGSDVTSTSWGEYEVVYKVGATTWWIVLKFYAEGASAGSVWYDEIYLWDLLPELDGEDFNNGDKGSAWTLDWSNGLTQRVRLTASHTISWSNIPKGVPLTLRLVQDGTGGRTPTLSGVIWSGGSAPTWVTTANHQAVVVLYSPDGSALFGSVYGLDFNSTL